MRTLLPNPVTLSSSKTSKYWALTLSPVTDIQTGRHCPYQNVYIELELKSNSIKAYNRSVSKKVPNWVISLIRKDKGKTPLIWQALPMPFSKLIPQQPHKINNVFTYFVG